MCTCTKGATDEKTGVKPRFLPPLSEPIAAENGWCVMEDSFFCITILLRSHLTTDGLLFPELAAHDPDGSMWAMIGRGPIARRQLLTFFLNSVQHGSLMGQGAERIRIRAFRIEPLERSALSAGGGADSRVSAASAVSGGSSAAGKPRGQRSGSSASIRKTRACSSASSAPAGQSATATDIPSRYGRGIYSLDGERLEPGPLQGELIPGAGVIMSLPTKHDVLSSHT